MNGKSPNYPSVWSREIIAAYLFKNKNSVTIIVTRKRYRNAIENFLTPHLHVLDLINMCYQEIGATSHTAWITMEWHTDISFQNKLFQKMLMLIGLHGHLIWLFRAFSCGDSWSVILMQTNQKRLTNSKRIFVMKYRMKYVKM